MYKRKAVVAAAVGLHARPAAVFVRAVNQTGLPVILKKEGMPAVDGRSLLEVMSGDFEHGVEIEVSVAPCDATEATIKATVDQLAVLLEGDLSDAS